MKTIGLMPRRHDISRAAFRDHYENRHAPLALGYFPFEKYVRNHLVSSDPDPIGFDCLSEFWVEDVEEIYRLMASAIGDIMREDELRFTDQPNIGPAVAEETHIAGPSRGVDEGPLRKEALLLSRKAGLSKEAYIDGIIRWGAQLVEVAGGRLTRVSFDFLTPFEGRPFPRCDGVLYGWVEGEGAVWQDVTPPQGIEIYARLVTDALETRF